MPIVPKRAFKYRLDSWFEVGGHRSFHALFVENANSGAWQWNEFSSLCNALAESRTSVHGEYDACKGAENM